MKQSEITCLTRNTNIKASDDVPPGSLRDAKKTGSVAATESGKPSLFGKVLKRRKSRQSNFAPGIIDFDYAGHSAKYHHLIKERKDLGQPNTSQLNFEMKLRTYRNLTDYNAQKPWSFPAVKQFSPKK